MHAPRSKKDVRTIHVYKSYNFIDKDPVIGFALTAFQRSGKTYKKIHADSGVSIGTPHNWFNGKTRRPQFATMAAFLIACGVREVDLIKLRRGGHA
jgi:hypothetical protein